MTVELDNVIKNLNGEVIHLEIFEEDGVPNVYLSTDSDSGCGYTVQSIQDVADMVKHYLNNYSED